MTKFEESLKVRYRKYLAPAWEGWRAMSESNVMGIVLQDANPKRRSAPEWLDGRPLYDYGLDNHCPIFILFEEHGGNYTAYTPAVDAMIKAIYQSGWQRGLDTRVQGGPQPLQRS